MIIFNSWIYEANSNHDQNHDEVIFIISKQGKGGGNTYRCRRNDRNNPYACQWGADHYDGGDGGGGDDYGGGDGDHIIQSK